MEELLKSLDWDTILATIWTVILLPILTYAGTQLQQWAKAKKLDRYTNILQQCVLSAVKDLYQTVVDDLKGTPEWTDEKKQEIKEMAKNKAIQALSNTVYATLKEANSEFEEYLDSLVEASLYDLKKDKE